MRDAHTAEGRIRTAILTCAALVAFAANSLLCRQALGASAIDPAGFAALRLTSGAIILVVIARLKGSKREDSSTSRGSWGSAAALLLYAVTFAFAYVSLSAGTGALILFGAVQATMILSGLWAGERPQAREWIGLLAALAGLVYLVLPGLSAPSPAGSALMAVAGIAWGVYSLRGRGGGDPVAVTTGNFVRSVPLALAVALPFLPSLHLSPQGALLAIGSGSLASGIGYVVWYAALGGLTATRAATVQLAVPVLAGAGGVLFLSEEISLRLLVSAVAILGGVGLAVQARARPAPAAKMEGPSDTLESGEATAGGHPGAV